MISFTDSPEDLIARAKSVSSAGRMRVDEQTTAEVPAVACRLLDELGRALEVERQSRAQSYAAMRAQNLGVADTEERLRKAQVVNRALATMVVGLLFVDAIVTVHGGLR